VSGAAACPLRVVIVDDEAPARSRVRDLIEDCAAAVPAQVVGEASNGRELLALLEETGADVVLLDIRMPEMDGIEAAQHLLKLTPRPAVIFTTAFDAYALKAFELHAVDYLVKPIRLQRLQDALSRVRAQASPPLELLQQLQTHARRHVSVQERGKVILVPVDKILYLRAELKYVTVRTAERDYLLDESLTRLEEEFGARFVRIHRSCLVARDHIERFERAAEEGAWSVLLRGLDERLPVSRRQQHVIREFAGV